MLGIIITIIIVLHLVMFVFLYYLHTQLQAYKKMHVKDLTTLMDTYMEEIKLENNRLESELKKASFKRSDSLEEPIVDSKHELLNQPDRFEKSAYKGPSVEKFSKAENIQQPSIEAQVLQLHAKGMSLTDIAKKLQCGKTEAELIINLHAKTNKT